jgi:hypothetical protein
VSGWVLVVALVALAVTLLLGVSVLRLGRAVDRLRAEVAFLVEPSHESTAAAAEARMTARRPAQSAGRDALPIGQTLPSEHGPDDDVLRPTPLGAPAVEPDLSTTRVASVTLSGPLLKVAAFSSGVRHAFEEETRMRVAYAFRKELRRQHRVRRKRDAARAAGPPRDGGWHP